jgi:hypothetical protein
VEAQDRGGPVLSLDAPSGFRQKKLSASMCSLKRFDSFLFPFDKNSSSKVKVFLLGWGKIIYKREERVQ